MKKNRLMKVTSILAAAIMTASAAFTTVSADETNASIALQNVEAAAGGTVEIPLTIYSENQCTLYDLVLEHDSRLKFTEAEGARAAGYEDAGKSFVSLVRFELEPFQDGEAAATIKFEVPKDATIGDTYTVDFSHVESFSSMYEEFEDYTLSGATVTVTEEYDPSVEEEEKNVEQQNVKLTGENMVALEGRDAMAGELVEVPLVMYTNSQCTSYDLLIEYDSRLELQSVFKAKSVSKYEDAGRKFVSITGFENSPYKDGEAAATLALYVPDEADTDLYEVKLSEIACISTDDEEITEYTTSDTFISVTAREKSEDGISETKIYKRYGSRENIVETMVGVRGDVNGDGKANIKDAVTIAKACATRNLSCIDEKGKFFGDVNDDGSISIKDAMRIARFVAKGKVSWNF